MSSYANHVTTETVFGQTLALWLGDRDKHRAQESDTTGLNFKGNLCGVMVGVLDTDLGDLSLNPYLGMKYAD